MCNNHWKKYAEPLHMIKKYYGEKMAFYVAFMLNYTAHLFVPAILGIALFSYQMWLLYTKADRIPTATTTTSTTTTSGTTTAKPAVKKESLNEIIDNPYNALMGVIVSIWGSILIERWKEMEQELTHEWDMDTLEDVLKSDERVGEY
jgi:hypothetical protein